MESRLGSDDHDNPIQLAALMKASHEFEVFLTFLAGDGDDDVNADIRRNLEDPGSKASHFIRGFRLHAERVWDVDWGALPSSEPGVDPRLAAYEAVVERDVDCTSYIPLRQIVAHAGAHSNSWRFLGSAIALACFWGGWCYVLSRYVPPLLSVTYCSLELLLAELHLLRRRAPLRGTLVEAAIGGVFGAALALLPFLFLCVPVFQAISGVTVITAFVVSRVGMTSGFGLHARSTGGELTLMGVLYQFIVLWLVNLGAVFCGLFIAIVMLVLTGVMKPRAPMNPEDVFVFMSEWCALLSMLPAGARCIVPGSVRCSFPKLLVTFASGLLFIPLVAAAVFYVAGDEFTFELIGILCAFWLFGASLEGRTAVYKGYEQWWSEKKESLVEAVDFAEGLLVALVAVRVASLGVTMLAARFPQVMSYGEIAIALGGIVGFFVGFSGVLRRFLPRAVRDMIVALQRREDFIQKTINVAARLPSCVFESINEALRDTIGFYRRILTTEVTI